MNNKKLTAFLLAVITAAVYIIPNAAFAKSSTEIYNAGDIMEFIEYVSEAEEKYEEDDISLFSLDEEASADNPYNRLILRTDGNVDYFGALYAVKGYKDIQIVQYSTDEQCREAYENYSKMSQIESVEFDIEVELCDEDVSDDSAEDIYTQSVSVPVTLPSSWGYDSAYIDVRGYQKKYLADKELPEVIVAVIDSGANINHTLIKDRIVNPYNVVTATSTETDMADKEQSHGTHVCGIIADGTLSNVKIMPVKIMSSTGSIAMSNLTTGIEYAVSKGADVINMSLGAVSLYSSTLSLAKSVQSAIDSGVAVVAAAGNYSINVVNMLPANVPDVISVSAIGMDNVLASYSDYGEEIDIAAPGTSILSSVYSSTDNSATGKKTGTSMACPHISACVADILSYSSGITSKKAELLLKYNAKKSSYSLNTPCGNLARLSDSFVFDGVVLNTNYAETAVGGELTLTADTYKDGETLTWSTSDESIAEVDSSGNITAKAAGTVTVTASNGSVSDSCNLTVYDIGDWYSSDETEYIIDTPDELLDVAELTSCRIDDFSGKTIKLGADLDCSDIDWLSIGYNIYTYDGEENFNGTFDGQNHTIDRKSVV